MFFTSKASGLDILGWVPDRLLEGECFTPKAGPWRKDRAIPSTRDHVSMRRSAVCAAARWVFLDGEARLVARTSRKSGQTQSPSLRSSSEP